jgi:hypothetical protein
MTIRPRDRKSFSRILLKMMRMTKIEREKCPSYRALMAFLFIVRTESGERSMKKSCGTCAYQTDENLCNAKHIRWRDSNLKLESVKNCLDWKGRGGSNGKRAEGE